MDFVYVAAPAFTTFLFAYLAVNTDPKTHAFMRNFFFFTAICSLIVFTSMAQNISLYGEMVPDITDTTFTYTNGTLTGSQSSSNWTHISPLTASDYTNVWLVLSIAVWGAFLFFFFFLLLNALMWFKSIVMRTREEDEIG